MKMLETIHILPRARGERCAPPLRGKKLDQRAVLQVVRKVDWKKGRPHRRRRDRRVRRSRHSEPVQILSGASSRASSKKQLAPLNDKLDALQAENRMLRAELEKKNAPSEEQN